MTTDEETTLTLRSFESGCLVRKDLDNAATAWLDFGRKVLQRFIHSSSGFCDDR
jgi:hypothetical protein